MPLYFKFNKSLPNNLIIKPIGVTTKKNITPITNGETTLPKIIPNLNHNLFNGAKNLEFKTPKTKKTKDKIKAHNLIVLWVAQLHLLIVKL